MGLLLVRLCSLSRPRRKTELLLKSKSLFAFAVLDSHPVAIFVKSAISCLPPCLMLSWHFAKFMLSYLIFWKETAVSEKTNSLNPHQIGCCATLFFPEHLKTLAPKALTYLVLDSLIHTEFTNRTRQTKNYRVHQVLCSILVFAFSQMQFLYFPSHRNTQAWNKPFQSLACSGTAPKPKDVSGNT